MDINEIISPERNAVSIIGDLKRKTISVPSWSKLAKEYNPNLHPVMTDPNYRDKVTRKGVEHLTRITLGLQRLAVKRMGELAFGIPVKRVYKPKDDAEKKAAEIMEAIFAKNRIDSVNIERSKYLYASCEVVTLWFSREAQTTYGGEVSPIKLRCKNYSPMKGDALYPLFDEYDDMIALSIEYTRYENSTHVVYFDTYTATEHVRWRTEGGNTTEEIREPITLGKITGVYAHRDTPIWEDQSQNVYEVEWTLSRNGNYIRKNARPNWVVFSDNKITFGKESNKDNEGRNVLKYGKDDKAQYVTWQQAIDSIKFHVDEIKRNFFMELQLPDMSMENMKATPMSGEARKMMFIDAQLKVRDESGLWLEYFDREINVVRAFMKAMFPALAKAIDALNVEVEITAYIINDDETTIKNLVTANGGKAIMSQRESVEYLGWSADVDRTMAQIADDNQKDVFEQYQ